jgi:hypothetical protein
LALDPPCPPLIRGAIELKVLLIKATVYTQVFGGALDVADSPFPPLIKGAIELKVPLIKGD